MFRSDGTVDWAITKDIFVSYHANDGYNQVLCNTGTKLERYVNIDATFLGYELAYVIEEMVLYCNPILILYFFCLNDFII